MATIDYTKRGERLGNHGAVQKAMSPVVPDFMSGVDRSGAWERAYAREGRGWDAVAQGGAEIGRAVLALDALLQGRENERKVAKAAGMVMNINDENLTNPERDGDGRALGLLNRTGEECSELPREGHESLVRTVDAVSEELELTDRQVEMLKDRLSPYAMSCMGRLRARRQSEISRIQVEDAKALYEADVRTIADGNNSDAMYEAALADFDGYLKLAGVRGERGRLARDTFVRTLFAADVKRTVSELKSREDFDKAIDAAEKRPESLFMGNEVLRREMGGEVGKELHAQLVKEMRTERERFLGRERHEKMLEAERVKGTFLNRELEAMGKDMPATEWIAFYRECGEDPELKAASPETALQYMKHAERLEKAVKKSESDHTESSLAGRMNNLTFLEMDGGRANGNRVAAEQAALWRDFQEAMHAGKLSEGFASTFMNRMKNRLTDEERTAMREFYSSFGWHGDLNGEGEPSAKDRRDWAKARVLAPVDETVPLTSDMAKGRRLTGSQMFELGDTFLRELRAMGPEAYRPEAMRAVLGEVKARRMAGDFAANRDYLAWKMMNIQRNLNAGEGSDGRTGGPGDRGGEGRREDD